MQESDDPPNKSRKPGADRSGRSLRPLPAAASLPVVPMKPERASRTRNSKNSQRPGFWQLLFGRKKKGTAETRLQSETTLQPSQPALDRYRDGLDLFQPGKTRPSAPPTQLGAARRLPPGRSQPSSGSTLPFKRRPDPTQLRPANQTRLERSPQNRTVLQTNTVLQPSAPTRLEGPKQRRDRRPVDPAARRDRPSPPPQPNQLGG